MNSEDPDEMLHDAAFHLGLHCLLKQKRSSGKKKIHFISIYKLTLLDMYKELSQVHCIKPEGRIH